VGFCEREREEKEREREREKESEKNMESARDGETKTASKKDDEEEDGDENREGRGKITSFLRRSLTKRFVKLLEKTEERVERLERKSRRAEATRGRIDGIVRGEIQKLGETREREVGGYSRSRVFRWRR